MSPIESLPTARPRVPSRSLVTEVLTAQLAIMAVVGAIALAGLAWTAGSVIRNNLTHWAAQWAAELNEFGAPFYLSDEHEAVLGVERFIAKYPEIDHVTWYRRDGSVLLSLDNRAPSGRARPRLDGPSRGSAGRPRPARRRPTC